MSAVSSYIANLIFNFKLKEEEATFIISREVFSQGFMKLATNTPTEDTTMKIKVCEKSFEEVMAIPQLPHTKPVKQALFFRWLLKTLSASELKKVHFTCERVGMELLSKQEPCLYLMNHSSFIDLKIASSLIYPKSFHIVCTSDGFVGKKWLMTRLGCIPTRKFTMDVNLVRDMTFTLQKLKSSILMYPEASYSFDGTATPLPDSIGKCIKMMNVPVVMIQTKGAFHRDPLYNGLQIRDVDVSAKMECILTKEQIAAYTPAQINSCVNEQFSFDQFRWQQDNQIAVAEDFRADKLNRVLYKCPVCKMEGQMEGKGVLLTCKHCGKYYKLTELGYLEASDGKTEFDHVPDWYRWQRDCVHKELEQGTYRMELPVEIYMMVDYKAIYHVGNGTLSHDETGFDLRGCDGKLAYHQTPEASYSLYSDYYWYELGDMICIGDHRALYYCFPKSDGDIVAKARLAAEELYKLKKAEKSDKSKNKVANEPA